MDIHKNDNLYFSTTKACSLYTEIKYPKDVYILFGKETKGLPETLLESNLNKTIRIPMNSNIRSLNLSNSAAIITYEILRQLGFETMQLYGKYGNS
jgi:tRNA (cytidine/uridine-2'-O-)-methyltransferase